MDDDTLRFTTDVYVLSPRSRLPRKRDCSKSSEDKAEAYYPSAYHRADAFFQGVFADWIIRCFYPSRQLGSHDRRSGKLPIIRSSDEFYRLLT